jgi:endoribonuclease Dicer
LLTSSPALIDLVVMDYLVRKFPHANSGQLSWARSRAVCGPTLAFIAIRKLKLHKLLLINNVELSIAISRYVPILEDLCATEIVTKGWKHDPPKALSDALESTLGAVLVDMAWNYDRASAVVHYVLEEVLEVLTPDLPKDPVSELMTWVAKSGCHHIRFQYALLCYLPWAVTDTEL